MTLTFDTTSARSAAHLPLPALRSLRMSAQPVAAEDAAFYVDLLTRPELNKHRPDARMRDAAACAAALQADMAHWSSFGFGRYRLTHAAQSVGLGGLTQKEGFSGLNLSYHLLPDWWGIGLASEFVRTALDFASDRLGAASVYGLVRPSNTASIRVLEKAGFARAGDHIVGGAPMRELRRELR